MSCLRPLERPRAFCIDLPAVLWPFLRDSELSTPSDCCPFTHGPLFHKTLANSIRGGCSHFRSGTFCPIFSRVGTAEATTGFRQAGPSTAKTEAAKDSVRNVGYVNEAEDPRTVHSELVTGANGVRLCHGGIRTAFSDKNIHTCNATILCSLRSFHWSTHADRQIWHLRAFVLSATFAAFPLIRHSALRNHEPLRVYEDGSRASPFFSLMRAPRATVLDGTSTTRAPLLFPP